MVHDGDYFPGEVMEVSEDNDFLVSVMHPAGRACKFASLKDEKTSEYQ